MTAQRIVRFYEIVNRHRERFPNTLPFEDLMDAVRALPDADAYVSVPRMELLGSAYHPPSGAGARRTVPLIALDRITRDIRLRIERRRNYRPLILDPDETLAEPAFYSIFDRNVLAVMRNSGAAPGPASFRNYINTLELVRDGIEVTPLADRNALRALADVGTLTKVDLAVGPDVSADVFGQAASISGVIRHVREQLGSVGIEVTIRIAAKGQHDVAGTALREVRSIATSDAVGHVDKAEINYRSIEDGRARTYDFIDEVVAKAANVDLDDTTGQPTELSVAQGIAAAYDELYEDILSALNSSS